MFAYVKSGNVGQELLAAHEAQGRDSGDSPLSFMAAFLELVRQHGEQPLVLATAPGGGDPGAAGPVRVVSVGHRSRLKVLHATLMALFTNKPSHVLCGEHGFPLLACALYRALTRSQVVFACHNRFTAGGSGFKQRALGAINRWSMQRMDGLVCHGPYLEAAIHAVVEMTVPVYRFETRARILEPQSAAAFAEQAGEVKPILFLGRVTQEKGVFDLLEAVASLDRNDLRLEFIGGGPDLAALQARIRSLGLDECVQAAGPIPHADVFEKLRHAYALVTPTRQSFPEGRCMAAIEGMGCGVPVIAPDFGPFPWLVRDSKNGLRYAPDSPKALAGAIARLADDAALRDRLGAQAREDVRAVNEADSFLEALVKAFAAVDQVDLEDEEGKGARDVMGDQENQGDHGDHGDFDDAS